MKNSIIQKNKKFDEINNSFIIIKLIIMAFSQYPCNSVYKSLESIDTYIKKLKSDKLNFRDEKEFLILHKIRRKKDLVEKYEQNIYSIRINKSNFNDISII